MRKLVEILGCSIILLFYASYAQAQYAVFKIKGTVEMSLDGKAWKQLKMKEQLKESYQIRVRENSSIDIIGDENRIYSYTDRKIVSVGDIVKQGKTTLQALNANSGKRSNLGVINRPIIDTDTAELDFLDAAFCLCDDVCPVFKEAETSNQYDEYNLIPAGTVFFISICNATDTNKWVNVYQKDADKGLIPCFPQDIHLEPKTAVEIPDALFGKQEEQNNKFIIFHENDKK